MDIKDTPEYKKAKEIVDRAVIQEDYISFETAKTNLEISNNCVIFIAK